MKRALQHIHFVAGFGVPTKGLRSARGWVR